MKHLLILLILLPSLCYSQAMIGYSEYEVKRQYAGHRMIEDVDHNGKFILIDFDCANFAFFIPHYSDVVKICLAYPKGRRCFLDMVYEYNTRFRSNGRNKWFAYLDSGAIMSIELVKDDYFTYQIL